MGKKGTYNIHDILPFGKVIWGINPKRETVTCILEVETKIPVAGVDMSWDGPLYREAYKQRFGPSTVTFNKKIIKTTKASHGDTFDIDTGMARSLFKCMVSAGLFKNLTSWNKVKKTIRGIEDDRDKTTVRESIVGNEGPVSDTKRELDPDRVYESIDSITEVVGGVSEVGKRRTGHRDNGTVKADI